jgi:hypothetical protein
MVLLLRELTECPPESIRTGAGTNLGFGVAVSPLRINGGHVARQRLDVEYYGLKGAAWLRLALQSGHRFLFEAGYLHKVADLLVRLQSVEPLYLTLCRQFVLHDFGYRDLLFDRRFGRIELINPNNSENMLSTAWR